jgi:hypothetical protein
MTVYHYQANSNAAPFFSDPSDGFVEANTPMDALKKVVSEYTHPCGLFAANIETCEPTPKKLARFLCASAVAQQKAIELSHGGIRRDGNKYRILNEKIEEVFLTIKQLAPNGDLFEDLSDGKIPIKGEKNERRTV